MKSKRAMTTPMIDRRYEAEDALRTLSRAEEIKRDKALMGHVKRIHAQHAKAIAPKPTSKKKQ